MKAEQLYDARVRNNATRMKRQPTPAEFTFAKRLREAGVHFLTQCVMGRYILDFVFPSKMLVIELDGNRHSTPIAIKYDQERTRFLQSIGFEVKRIHNSQAETYPVHKIKNSKSKRVPGKTYQTAKKQAKDDLLEYRRAVGARIERNAIDRAHKAAVERHALRKPVVIKRAVS